MSTMNRKRMMRFNWVYPQKVPLWNSANIRPSAAPWQHVPARVNMCFVFARFLPACHRSHAATFSVSLYTCAAVVHCTSSMWIHIRNP